MFCVLCIDYVVTHLDGSSNGKTASATVGSTGAAASNGGKKTKNKMDKGLTVQEVTCSIDDLEDGQ